MKVKEKTPRMHQAIRKKITHTEGKGAGQI